MPGKVGHDHLDHHIARIELARGRALFSALAQLHDLFGRNHHFLNESLILAGANHLVDGLLHTLLKTRIGVHNVPARLFAQLGIFINDNSVFHGNPRRG